MLNMYEYIVTCLDAMSNPDAYRDKYRGEMGFGQRFSHNCQWTEIVYEDICEYCFSCCFVHKLQYRDNDIYYAYTRIDRVIEEVAEMRNNIHQIWEEWYTDIRKIANK